MIILEENEQTQLKQDPSSPTNRSTASEVSQPPPYAVSAPEPADVEAAAEESNDGSRSRLRRKGRRQSDRHDRRRRFRRICKFVCAVIVISLINTWLVLKWSGLKLFRKAAPPQEENNRHHDGHGSPGKHSGEHQLACNGSLVWSTPRYTSTFDYVSASSLNLPRADPIYMISKGSSTTGQVLISTHNSSDDSAMVQIDARHKNPTLPNGVQVCLSKSQTGRTTIIIIGPDSDDGVVWNITILLPSPVIDVTSNPGYNIDLKMPNFLYATKGDLFLSSLSLATTNAPIIVDGLHADVATLETSSAIIRGKFNISWSLSLTTSNAPVFADIHLHNDDRLHTSVELATSQGLIESTISLYPPAKHKNASCFAISATAPCSPLNITFPTSPIGAHLQVNTQSSDYPAIVSLDEQYQGMFFLVSDESPQLVQKNIPSVQSSSRTRRVTYFRKDDHLSGNVRWDRSWDGLGWVNVTTSNGASVLQL